MRKGEKKPQKEQDRKRESLRKVPPARPPPFFLLLPAPSPSSPGLGGTARRPALLPHLRGV